MKIKDYAAILLFAALSTLTDPPLLLAIFVGSAFGFGVGQIRVGLRAAAQQKALKRLNG